MAVLEKLRGWGIILSILVALPLLLFIIDPSQIIQTVQSVSSKYDVGKIAGKSISYTDFQQAVEQYSRITEQLSGNSASSEQQQQQIRNAVWQNFVDQNLFIKNAQAAGLNVGKDELLDLTNGEHVSPVIASIFVDQNGNFSDAQLRAFLENVADGDENARAIWNYLQQAVITSQYYNKYNSLFTGSNIQNAIQVNRSIADNNTTADVDFVMSPFSFATDSTVVVSDSEIKDFYNNHKDFFKQVATRDIEYAVFQVVPSAEDIAATNNDFVKQYDEFAVTDNVRSFLQRNSDVQWSDRWYKAGDLKSVNTELDTFVSENAEGVSPVYTSGNTFYAGRIMASATMPETVTVRHMMFQSNADGQHLADSLLGVLKQGGDFAALAQEHSLDRGSNADGEFGKIGQISQATVSYLPTGFDAIFTAKKGEPFILQSNVATHIVEVTETGAPALFKQVAVFQKEALASKETFNKFYNDANRLATLAGGKYANYRAACDSIGTYSHNLTINEATDTYGSIGHAKEVTRWAFDNKPGKVSNIITVDNNYFFVVAVKGAHKEGYAEVSEVADQIKNQLYSEKYAEKRQGEVAARISGMEDLEAIAEKLGTTVSHQNDVAFAAMSARSLDPKFVGAIAAAPEGKICGPVAGSYGVYVFKVLGRETGSFYTDTDAKNANADILNYAVQMIVPVMMQDADVKDNRARFY
ncbi:MAG: SurA N-terminal domain-containing protein [Bacteroidales bacterium]|nr:SurA N-terminal domain-containing protein [Bacteroidales bacterium]